MDWTGLENRLAQFHRARSERAGIDRVPPIRRPSHAHA